MTDAVSMMNLLAAAKWPTEFGCHYFDMLRDVAVLMCVGVVGLMNVDIALIVDNPTVRLAKWSY